MDEQQEVGSPDVSSNATAPFPVVGIGASAGGLPALIRLLERMPPAPGMALVVVLHLAPDAPSIADRLLQRSTVMPVLRVRERMRLMPDHVYVISPGRSLRMEDGHLIADEAQCALGIPMTVNVFFRTLAEAHGEQAIGVVLSGMGSDGAAGLAHIKGHGGVTIAQLPGDAEERGMPQAAIDSGMVDFVLPAARIAARLAAMRAAMRNNPQRRPQGSQGEAGAAARRFFSGRDAFDMLEQTILPRVFHERRPDQPPRAWVAACATGEDAYSLGMLLAERAGSDEGVPAMQIFATDADEDAIAAARVGRYPATIAADVAPERLARFFVADGDRFKVRRLLRDRILFARHDLLHDPAFAHLDLVTCRDVLAGLASGVRRQVLEVFHDALKPGGYLFLGDADCADQAPDLFTPVDTRHRLYQATATPKPAGRLPPRLVRQAGTPRGGAARHDAPLPPVAELHQRVLARLAPPSLLLNGRGEVVHVAEHAAAFLGYGGGEPSTQVLALVLPALRKDLRILLSTAAASGSPARSGPVRYEQGGRAQAVGLAVLPVPAPDGGADWMLVQFEAAEAAPGVDAAADPRVQALEGALLHARNSLQQTIDRAETAGTALHTSNQRLQATVDGLRAEIDELELNREEMQSRNEELQTVNAELQIRFHETSKANDDLSNLIASTDIATLFLDQRMQIKRYTPHVTRIFNIIPADVGRPLAHISNRLETTRLLDDVAGVFTSLQPIERELRSTDGRDYIVRVHPYRTAYERVEGVVMTFFDITSRRAAEKALQEGAQRQAFLLALADAVRGECSADAVAEHALRMLAAELRLDRCCILAWQPDAGRAQVMQQAGNERVAPLPATLRLADAPAPLRAPPARTLAIADLQDGLPGMCALVAATLRAGDGNADGGGDGKGGGGPVWSMLAICAAPRRWTHGEIALVEEAAERAWNAIVRLRAEATAARAERRAESILEHMGDAHSILDREFRIVGVNAAAERLLGRSRTTLLGRSHWDAFPGSVDAPVGRAFRRVVEEGVEQHLTHHYTGEGYDLHLEVDAYPTDDGGVAMFWRDVTERVRAELALRAREEKYRALFNEMDEAYAVVEVIADAAGHWSDFRYVEVNPAFMRHTGMPCPVGRTATELLGTPNPRWAELYGRAAQTGQPVRVEEAELTLGRVFDLNIFRLGEAGSRRVAVLFSDITERKQGEEALKAADRRKDEFLATLAHELRNPLAPISNALQFLRNPDGKRRADRLLAMVERQVRHMVRLVDDLMDVTRISRGKVDLRRAPVALADILGSAVETSLPGFEQKRQQLALEPVDPALTLDADKVRLTQVFANLLNNASRYTPAGGQAWLGVRRDGSQAVVTVRDDGMGIGKEQLPLVFEMFSQPHGRNGHSDSGLGIGLAMVRSLVALHGGSVEAHSDGPGAGSAFVVRLPLADCRDAVPGETGGALEEGAAPLAGKRVLVVDDNRDAADSLCQLLAARGVDATAAYAGHAAIEALDATPPHAIVLDIGMPDMDGYEVARRIRQDGRAGGIRLVALSGWGQQADRQRSRASGFDHHLTKPAELDSLLRILSAP